jgi:hypothetical protein
MTKRIITEEEGRMNERRNNVSSPETARLSKVRLKGKERSYLRDNVYDPSTAFLQDYNVKVVSP